MTLDRLSEADGYCPECESEIDLAEYYPKLASDYDDLRAEFDQFKAARREALVSINEESKLVKLTMDDLRAENERLEREAKNDLIAYKAVIERQEELRAELAALKAVPDGVEVVGWLHRQGNYTEAAVRPLTDDEEGRGWEQDELMTVAQHNARMAEKDAQIEALKTVLLAVQEQFKRFGERFPDGFDGRVFRWVDDAVAQHAMELAALRQPVDDEREAFEGWARGKVGPLDKVTPCDGSAPWYIESNAKSAWLAWQARAALSAPAAGQDVSALIESHRKHAARLPLGHARAEALERVMSSNEVGFLPDDVQDAIVEALAANKAGGGA